MSAYVSSLATAVPEYTVTQESIVQLLSSYMNLSSKDEKLLQRIYQATGIKYRHSVISDYQKHTTNPIFFPKNAKASYPSTAERMVLYETNALSLALKAINKCFKKRLDRNRFHGKARAKRASQYIDFTFLDMA